MLKAERRDSMRGRSNIFSLIVGFALIFLLTVPTIAYAKLSDGTYELLYEMKERSSENTSIADGYFTKPAILYVEDGVKYIEITVTGADMIKELKAPSGPVEILDEDEENNERTVKFKVDQDLDEPLTLEMHVVVPDLYDTVHEARAFFDVESIEQITSKSASEEIENPQTGVKQPIGIYIALFIGSIAFLSFYRLKLIKG